MKFLVSVLLTALLGFSLGLYFPWWTVALSGFAVHYFLFQKPLISFASGFLGIFILWGLITMMRSIANDHILAHRISLMILKKDNPNLLIALSALIGGLAGGMGALCGSLLRKTRLTA